jgi:hypothetical protein
MRREHLVRSRDEGRGRGKREEERERRVKNKKKGYEKGGQRRRVQPITYIQQCSRHMDVQ